MAISGVHFYQPRNIPRSEIPARSCCPRFDSHKPPLGGAIYGDDRRIYLFRLGLGIVASSLSPIIAISCFLRQLSVALDQLHTII